VSFLYSDGFGRELQTKIQAEPGLAPGRDASGVLKCNENWVPTNPRWVGTGRKIYNNKGKPVKQYEPFFSPTHGYEDELDLVKCGVTPILFYDPLERVVATLHPNHTYEKVVFDPWQQATWDGNDTVALDPSTDDDVKGFFVDAEGHERLPKTKYAPTWYNRCQSGSPEAQRAARITLEAQKTDRIEKRYGTPTVAHLDTLGRPFLTVADNGIAADGTRQLYPTHVTLDIEGNPRWITDARGNRVMAYGYDLSGPDEDEDGEADDSHRIYLKSMDAGERWTLKNVAGNLMREWDSRGFEVQQAYDVLQRPTQLIVQAETPKLDAQGQSLEPPQTEVKRILAERLVYGEGHPEATQRNLIGQVYQQYDGAGVVTQADYDFKGNVTTNSRQLARAYKTRMDWAALGMATDLSQPEGKANTAAIATAAAALLETEPPFTTRTTYDALNRPTQMISPDNSVTCPVYNEANLLEKIRVNLRGATTTAEPPAPIWTTLVENINYNAKGQREGIAYGNGVTTTYGYDPETFRLTQLTTVRANGGAPLQDLHYTYDPVGNITEIRDAARQTIFFNNAVVSPSSQYEYDALYRLIRAEGREHLGQTGGRINAPQPTRDTDIPRVNLPHPGNGQAMGRYRQDYAYDPVGNILEMIHTGTSPAQPGWRRCYQYALDSNRLLSTGYQSDPRVGCPDENRYAAAPVYPDQYGYDAHGNMVKMPHLEKMTWDFEDQLQSTARQVVNNGGTPETTYYTYDARGQRVRKVTERQAAAGETPTRMKERIYLAGFELYREYNGNGTGVTLARETLHGMDDEQRIALVETKTIDTGNRDETPLLKPTIRYQLGNHLGSASLELDRDGAVISYEEYYPYGNTSYQAGRSSAEVSLKRYRYTGKERDEESGFYYHGARYYACWLGRWIASDTTGIVDGLNLYIYVNNRPILLHDPNGSKGEKKSTFWQRAFNIGIGVLLILGGAAEATIGGAGIVAPEPVATKVLGAVVFAHGVDTASTGLRMLLSGGKPKKTLTEQALGPQAELAIGLLAPAKLAISKGVQQVLKRQISKNFSSPNTSPKSPQKRSVTKWSARINTGNAYSGVNKINCFFCTLGGLTDKTSSQVAKVLDIKEGSANINVFRSYLQKAVNKRLLPYVKEIESTTTYLLPGARDLIVLAKSSMREAKGTQFVVGFFYPGSKVGHFVAAYKNKRGEIIFRDFQQNRLVRLLAEKFRSFRDRYVTPPSTGMRVQIFEVGKTK
jgi:RHS repeat-associated protein